MYMLQTTTGEGGYGSIGILGSEVLGLPGSAETYEDSPYIRRLNALLAKELAAVDVYSKFEHDQSLAQLKYHEAHQEAGRLLVRLVVANRGLPADRAQGMASSITLVVLEVCGVLPLTGASRRLLLRQLTRLETQLSDDYASLHPAAPLGDAEVLRHLGEKAAARAAAILAQLQ